MPHETSRFVRPQLGSGWHDIEQARFAPCTSAALALWASAIKSAIIAASGGVGHLKWRFIMALSLPIDGLDDYQAIDPCKIIGFSEKIVFTLETSRQ